MFSKQIINKKNNQNKTGKFVHVETVQKEPVLSDTTPLQKNDYIITQLIHLIEQDKFLEAIIHLSRLKTCSKPIKMSLASYFEQLKQYNTVLKILYTIPRYDRDTLVLDKMALCREKKAETVLISELKNIIPTSKTNEQKVDFPPLIKQIFARLFRTTGEPYLVGSTVHSLIFGHALKQNQDIDVVFAVPKGKNFQLDEFKQCPYNHQLFATKFEHTGVDCYVISAEKEHFVEQNVLTRDFTIGSIYINYLGDVLDPTGKGVTDLKNKILRTVISSKESFKQDPIRLLRAIKWNVVGYQSTTELIDALKNWQPSSNLNKAHLNAVARKHLLGFNKEQQNYYVRLLNEFGLAKKLFFCLPEAKTLSLTQLKQNLNIMEIYKQPNSTPGFFKYCFNSPKKYLTACAIQKAFLLCVTEGDDIAYLEKRLKHSTAIEALDLQEVNPFSVGC